MRALILFCFLILKFNLFSQVTFYRDIFRGGICVSGTSTGVSYGTVNLPYFMEPLSSIKKIFLITYANSPSNNNGEASNFNAIINGQNFGQNFSENALIFAPTNLGPTDDIRGHWTHISDITNQLILSGNQFSIDLQAQINTPPNCPSCTYGAPLLLILYENPNLEPINVEILINNQTNDNQISLNPMGLNPGNFAKDIAMGIHSDRLGGGLNDGYTFFINNTNVGNISLGDIPSIGSGVIGNYYYQNGSLTGLTDDTADDIIGGSDGLLKLNTYCNNTLNNLNIEVDYLQNTALMHNNLIGLYLAYSTPCDTFSVSVTPDTTICGKQNLQLTASGGVQYLWSASTGSAATELSCVDCPNPIFLGDSSRLFTVQIWNNDSCSVVRPVKVNVRDKPTFTSITNAPTLCGLESGYIGAVAQNSSVLPVSYALDNGLYTLSPTYTFPIHTGLDSGFHILHLKDGNGCISDTTVFLAVSNPTMALFSANPLSGAAPLFVSLDNNSISATDYSWNLNGVAQTSSFSSFVADTSGSYNIELIAWQHDVSCADTFLLSISVYDSLMVQIPNIFTPNNDGLNDVFGITSNLDLSITYEIFNRWGEELVIGNIQYVSTCTDKYEFYPIWDGKNCTEGVYFYRLLISPIDGKEQIKKEGFFHLEK